MPINRDRPIAHFVKYNASEEHSLWAAGDYGQGIVLNCYNSKSSNESKR